MLGTPPVTAKPPEAARAAAGPSASEEGRVASRIAPERSESESLAPKLEAGGGGEPDPAAWLALINPTGALGDGVRAAGAPEPSGGVAANGADIAGLLERWVRRVGLGGDTRRGVARLDIGSGRLSGAELLVVAEAGHVSVELSLPAGQVDQGLHERLRRRLTRRGFETEVVVR